MSTTPLRGQKHPPADRITPLQACNTIGTTNHTEDRRLYPDGLSVVSRIELLFPNNALIVQSGYPQSISAQLGAKSDYNRGQDYLAHYNYFDIDWVMSIREWKSRPQGPTSSLIVTSGSVKDCKPVT